MKAAFITQTGPPEVIQIGQLPDPQPGPGQVLVRVKAAAVNPVDTYIRAGTIEMPIPSPYVVGCDLAGVVEAVGPGVTEFKPGDRVWGSNQGVFGRQGTFAQLAAVDACWLYPIPDAIDFRTAAAISLVGITAHLGLFHKAGLKSGETLFVYGGSGGVGSCVVQMAKTVGARVITTAGTPEKAQLCRQLGADEVILYKEEDLHARLHELAPEGVNVWWETLREQNLELAVSHLAKFGRLVLMAGRDAKPAFPVGPFYVKDCTAYGFVIFNAPADVQRKAAEDINRWLMEGKLRPQIGRIMALEQTAEAHRLQEEKTLQGSASFGGKIVIDIPE